MGVKGSTKTCRTCNSPHRHAIEVAKIIDGLSYNKLEALSLEHAEIAGDLKQKLNATGIRYHFQHHVDEEYEVKLRYQEELRKAGMNVDDLPDPIKLKLLELRHLDDVIKSAGELVHAAAQELHRQLSIKIPRYVRTKDENGKDTGTVLKYTETKVSMSLVQLFSSAAGEVRQSSKAKRDILGSSAKTEQTSAVTNLADALVGLIRDDEADELG